MARQTGRDNDAGFENGYLSGDGVRQAVGLGGVGAGRREGELGDGDAIAPDNAEIVSKIARAIEIARVEWWEWAWFVHPTLPYGLWGSRPDNEF